MDVYGVAMEVGAYAGIAATIGGLVAGGFAAGRRVWRFIRKVSHFLDDWLGDDGRPGVPARPGMMVRVLRLEVKQDEISTQLLSRNGGSTLRDNLYETNRRLAALETKLDDHMRVAPAQRQTGTTVAGTTVVVQPAITPTEGGTT